MEVWEVNKCQYMFLNNMQEWMMTGLDLRLHIFTLVSLPVYLV